MLRTRAGHDEDPHRDDHEDDRGADVGLEEHEEQRHGDDRDEPGQVLHRRLPDRSSERIAASIMSVEIFASSDGVIWKPAIEK